MGRLDNSIELGSTQTIITKGKGGDRKVTFRKVKESGFGMWRIVSNKPAK